MTDELDGSQNESFVRWQELTISQLSNSINLFLGLTTATLGFAVGLLTAEDFHPAKCDKFFFDFGLFLTMCSIGAGIWATINRLGDFRVSMHIARDRGDPTHKESVVYKRNLSQKLGRRTWCLFHTQVALFGAGIILLISSVALHFADKIF